MCCWLNKTNKKNIYSDRVIEVRAQAWIVVIVIVVVVQSTINKRSIFIIIVKHEFVEHFRAIVIAYFTFTMLWVCSIFHSILCFLLHFRVCKLCPRWILLWKWISAKLVLAKTWGIILKIHGLEKGRSKSCKDIKAQNI